MLDIVVARDQKHRGCVDKFRNRIPELSDRQTASASTAFMAFRFTFNRFQVNFIFCRYPYVYHELVVIHEPCAGLMRSSHLLHELTSKLELELTDLDGTAAA